MCVCVKGVIAVKVEEKTELNDTKGDKKMAVLFVTLEWHSELDWSQSLLQEIYIREHQKDFSFYRKLLFSFTWRKQRPANQGNENIRSECQVKAGVIGVRPPT